MGFEHVILQILKTRSGRTAIAFLAVLATGFFSWVVVPEVPSACKLADRHALVEAQVISSRVLHTSYFRASYDLRYRFRVPPALQWYYQTDHTGRELWASLPRKDWDRAVNEHHVTVAYFPQDPNINDLAAELPNLKLWVVGFASVCLLLLGLSIAWFVIRVTKHLTGEDFTTWEKGPSGRRFKIVTHYVGLLSKLP